MLRLIEDNALIALERLRSAREQFHLVYMDPPFMSQQTYRTREGELAFEDRWSSRDYYVRSIGGLAAEAHGLLAPGGSLVVHVDPRTSHYLKVFLDGAVGTDRFASEIIWRYRRWSSKTPNFQRMHDVLLRYVRDSSEAPRWTQLYEPLAASTVRTFKGIRQWNSIGPDGKRVIHREKGEQRSPGAYMSDVWEISIPGQGAKQRTGYPTQKPEALLERLILALTHEGDTVLDPMCGSGTTLAVARRLGRHAVGIDSSPVAIRYARERLGTPRDVGPVRSPSATDQETTT